jgi:hypothetical protein
MLTKSRLDEIDARAGKATPGPWRESGSCIIQTDHVTRDVWEIPQCKSDTLFIAHARDDVPALVAEVRRLRTAIREIIDDASPCTTACHVTVAERLIKQAEELLDR